MLLSRPITQVFRCCVQYRGDGLPQAHSTVVQLAHAKSSVWQNVFLILNPCITAELASAPPTRETLLFASLRSKYGQKGSE